MPRQTQKVYVRREVKAQLDNIDNEIQFLARMMTESYGKAIPAPIKKRLQTLHKNLQENLIRIREDWAITEKEQQDKLARKLNKDRRPTKQTEIKPIDFAKMEKRVSKKKTTTPKPKPKTVKKPTKKKVKKPSPKKGANTK